MSNVTPFNPEQMKHDMLKSLDEVQIPEFDFDRIFAEMKPISREEIREELYEKNMKHFRRVQAISLGMGSVFAGYILTNKKYGPIEKIVGISGIGVVAATSFVIHRVLVEYNSNE